MLTNSLRRATRDDISVMLIAKAELGAKVEL